MKRLCCRPSERWQKRLKSAHSRSRRRMTSLRQGFVITVHGKGSYVASANQAQLLEEKKKEVETEFEQAIRKARSCGMEETEIRALFEIVLEDT